MHEETSTQDLKDRVALIECMIAEGRRSTESWGWAFLLWGGAYYVAIGWAALGPRLATWGGNGLAWPVTMIAAVVVTMIIAFRKDKGQPGTTVGRAIVSIWVAVGISMLLLFPALSISGRIEAHGFVAMVAAILGIANGASGMILKWKLQMGCAVVWWVTSIAACFGSEAQLTAVFLAALFFCQIAFGAYVMILESRRSRHSRDAHA